MESQSFWSKSYVHTLMAIALVGLIAALASYTYYTLRQSEGVYTGATTISVTGEGEVQVKPDLGMFSFSVRAEGKEATEAQSKSAEKINAIMAALKEGGVEEKDIKTTNYNLSPKYTYHDDRWCYRADAQKGEQVAAMPAPEFGFYDPCPYKTPTIDGYEVSQMVEVKVRDLAKAGDLISKSGEKGATDMSNLQFTVDDESISKAEAREKAITDAKEKAQKLAKDLDVRLVKMTSFYEQDGGMYPMYDAGYARESMAMSADFKAISPEMPIGENTVKITVNMTYEVK